VNIANAYEPSATAVHQPRTVAAIRPQYSLPRCRHGCSPLHFAAINGHLEVAQQLVNAGADANMKERCDPVCHQIGYRTCRSDACGVGVCAYEQLQERLHTGASSSLLRTRFISCIFQQVPRL
jgi:hypothetical protein